MSSRGIYWEPPIIPLEIPDQRNGHSTRPNKVAFKYPNFKKNVNPDVHVKVFNFVMKVNAKNFKNISSMRLVIC
jgi:hypothetical protein